MRSMIVHLIDGTYELFRHFYGLRRFTKGQDRPFGAVLGCTPTQLVRLLADHPPALVSLNGARKTRGLGALR